MLPLLGCFIFFEPTLTLTAAELSKEREENYFLHLQNYLEEVILARVKNELSNENSPGPSSKCQNIYSKIFDRREFEIRIAIGYNDSRPFALVDDLGYVNALVRHFLKPCHHPYNLCGFQLIQPVEGDGDVQLVREIRRYGGGSIVVKINFKYSAVGLDDSKNRVDPHQKIRSKQVEKFVLDGFAHSDFLFYLGHNRFGFGPDFSPPRLNRSKNAQFTYYFIRNKGNLLIQKGLSTAGPQFKLFADLSCDSKRKVDALLAVTPPQANLLVTDMSVTPHEQLEALLRVLNGVLGQTCQNDFFHFQRKGPLSTYLPFIKTRRSVVMFFGELFEPLIHFNIVTFPNRISPFGEPSTGLSESNSE